MSSWKNDAAVYLIVSNHVYHGSHHQGMLWHADALSKLQAPPFETPEVQGLRRPALLFLGFNMRQLT